MNLIQKNKTNFILALSLLFVIVGAVTYLYRPALGLDEFAKMTREDPLFYSPFFEVNNFNEAVAELEESEKKLKKTALHNMSLSKESYTESYTKLIQDTPLFPTNFLTLLPEISKKTEEFTTKPTALKARHLLSLYKQAQKAYEKDAKAMSEAYAIIDAHTPDDRPIYYFFTDSATSVKLAQENFTLIHKNSLALKEEIEQRQDCLSRKKDCEVTGPNKNNITLLNSEELIKLAAQVVPQGNNVDFIRQTLPYDSTTREVRGPYNITSSCWGSSIPQPMYAVYSTNENNEKTVLPKLADENYYNIISPKAFDVISRKIQGMGLRFNYQPEGTTYECSDLTFYPDILTLDFMSERLNAFSSDSEQAEYQKLWQNKFGLLAPAFHSLASFTNLLETSQRISGDFVLSPQFLFTTRSAYSLTYLPFAQSVWRIEEQPRFLLTNEEYRRLGAPQQFKTLTELKHEEVFEEEIKKSHINQIELIESLIK